MGPLFNGLALASLLRLLLRLLASLFPMLQGLARLDTASGWLAEWPLSQTRRPEPDGQQRAAFRFFVLPPPNAAGLRPQSVDRQWGLRVSATTRRRPMRPRDNPHPLFWWFSKSQNHRRPVHGQHHSPPPLCRGLQRPAPRPSPCLPCPVSLPAPPHRPCPGASPGLLRSGVSHARANPHRPASPRPAVQPPVCRRPGAAICS